MNNAILHYKMTLTFVALLIGCSNQGSQEPTTTAAVEATETSAKEAILVNAGATPAEVSEAPTDAIAATEPQLENPTTALPESSSAPAEPNQVDQAQLAAQAESQMEVSAAVPATQAGIDKAKVSAVGPAVATTGQAIKHHAASATQLKAKAIQVEKFNTLAARAAAPSLLSKDDTELKPLRAMSLKTGNVAISNLDESVRVNFALKAQDLEWRNASLAPYITEEFGCSGLTQDCLFWMRTGTKPAVFYKMRSPERYAIFWNEKDAIWDLRSTGRGGP